jgi:predicted phage tail protein
MQETDVNHGVVEVFAYQETLLMMAVFGIAILAMIWVGFRRWLQYKEKMGRLIAEQTAERAAQYGAQMERVEARLKTIEQIVTDGGDGGVQTITQVDIPAADSIGGEARPNP